MRTMRLALTVLLGGMVAACGAEVGDVGSSLTMVDMDTMTAQDLYMASDVSLTPLTEAQLAARGLEPSEAIPVRVEIFEEVAVAWFAPNGEAQIGRDSIVALWEVVDRHPISNETEAGTTPDLVHENGVIESSIVLADQTSLDVQQTDLTPLHPGAVQVIIDFADRVGTEQAYRLMERLSNSHPGCLE